MDLQSDKREYGRGVERRLDRLPEHLRAAAADLLAQIAKDCPPSGRLWDFGAGGDGYPVFDALLASCAEAGLGDERRRRAVFEGLACALLATAADELAPEQGGAASPARAPLARALLIEAERSFDPVLPPGSAFREAFYTACRDHAECLLWHQANHLAARAPYRDQDWLMSGRRWAPLKTGVAAVFCASGREADLPVLDRFLDELNALFQVRREILGIPRDAARGVHSLPIDRITSCLAGRGVGAERPEAILGALLLFDPLAGLIRECIERLALCRDLCGRLALTSFEPVIDRFRASFDALDDLFALKKAGPDRPTAAAPASGEGRGLVMGADPGLAARIEAAQSHLLADPEFGESWEVHRWGLLGERLLTGRVFPSGFILEMLLDGGLDLPDRLDALLAHWRRIDCRYFDEPCALPPDADSLGLLLRLLRFSRRRDAHAAMIRPALERMAANVTGEGDIPTYFTRQPPGEEPRDLFRHVAGNDCTGVKAGLALGLRDCGIDSCRTIAGRLQDRLLEAVAASGPATNAYYPDGYWLWMMSRLLHPLPGREASTGTDVRRTVAGILDHEFERLSQAAHLTAQQASWLVLSHGASAGPGDLDQDWVRAIVSGQSHDGGWPAEPIYLVPTWDNRIAWHRSRLMTTSVCHRALVHCNRRGMAA